MRNDKDNKYKFDKSSNNGNKPETKRTGENEITIFAGEIGNQIHEIRHGGQIARDEFDLNIDGTLASGSFGVSKEIDEYKAQFSFEGKIEYTPFIDFENQANLTKLITGGMDSFKQNITNMGQINNSFIQNLVDKPGLNQQFVYPRPSENPDYYRK